MTTPETQMSHLNKLTCAAHADTRALIRSRCISTDSISVICSDRHSSRTTCKKCFFFRIAFLQSRVYTGLSGSDPKVKLIFQEAYKRLLLSLLTLITSIGLVLYKIIKCICLPVLWVPGGVGLFDLHSVVQGQFLWLCWWSLPPSHTRARSPSVWCATWLQTPGAGGVWRGEETAAAEEHLENVVQQQT